MGNIGDLSVRVGADASPFKQAMNDISAGLKTVNVDFDATVQSFVAGGATLGEAIQKALIVPDTAPIAGALASIGESAAAAAEQMHLFDMAAHVDFADASGQFNLFATELESIGPSAQQAAEGMMRLPEALTELGNKAGETSSMFEKFGEELSQWIEHPVQSFRTLIEEMGPVAIATTAVVGGFLELTHVITELVLEEGSAARATQNLADRLNLGFEETKKLGEMASVVGVNIDSLARVSMRLADALQDPEGAGKKVAAALKSMGISASDSGEALGKLLEKLAEIPDATERINKAHEVMGKGAVQLEPLLRNYGELSAAIDSLGGKLDSEMVGSLLKANQAAGLLSIAWEHLKERLAVQFAPGVTAGIQLLTEFLTGPKTLTIDQQIETVRAEINSLNASAGAAGASLAKLMGGGFSYGAGMSGLIQDNGPLLQQKQAMLEVLEGVKQAADRSKEYNEVLDASNLAQKQAAASAHDYAAALYAAYSQLGVANFSSLLKGTADAEGKLTQFSGMGAFDALKDRLGDPRLIQAADNLEAKLQEAFHAGAVSADQFNANVQHVEDTIAEAAARMDAVKKTFQFPLNLIGPDDSQGIAIAKQKLDELYDSEQLVKAGAGGIFDQWDLMQRKLANSADEMKAFFNNTFATIERDAQAAQARISKAIVDSISQPLQGAAKALASAELSNAFGPDVEKLNAALKTLGLTADQTGQELTKSLAAFDVDAKSSVTSLDTVLLGWSKVSGTVSKLAQVDLPAAIVQYNILLDSMRAKGAAQGDLLAEQEKELASEIKLKELRGTDATAEIVKLTQLQYQTKALHDASAALGEIYVSVRKTFDSAFASLEKGLADAIVNGKNLGDVFVNVGKQIATALLETVIKGALIPLQTELNKTGGMFESIAKGFKGLFGKSGGGLNLGGATGGAGGGGWWNSPFGGSGGGAGAPTWNGIDPVTMGDTSGLVTSTGLPGANLSNIYGSSVSPAANAAAQGTSVGGSAGGAGGLLSSLNPIMGLVQAGITAIAGIVQGFQMARLINLEGEIEVTSRKILNSISNGYEGTSLIESGTRTWQNLNVVIDTLSQLHSDNVEMLGKFDDLIQGGGFGGGGGTGGGLSAFDLSLLQDLGSNLTNLTQTLSTQANSLIYGGGAGGTSISYAPISQSLAYTLPQAINTTTQAFANMRNPLDLVAQSLRGLPTALTGVADAASQMAPSPFAGGVPQQGPGGNNTYASILALTEGTGNISDELNGLRKTLADDLASGRTDAVALAIEDGLRQHIMQLMPYTGATLTTDTKGRHNWNASPWASGMPSAGIDVSAYTNTSLPMTPTPADPFTGGSSNFFPGRATVTVNALDVTGRSIADATIKGLREMGVKV